MAGRFVCGIAALAGVLVSGLVCADENWPQWRGPNLNGVVEAKGLPTKWSETENVVWKTELPSWSGSTPVIWGDRIFVASPSKPEAADAKAGGPNLLLLCLSKKDGHILWERELDTGNAFHSKQNDSSPSPVTDGTHVWAVTGTGTVVGLTMDGEILWKKNLQTDYGKFVQQFGFSTSPLLYNGKVILQVLHGFFAEAPSYLVAFDGPTGNVAWRIKRPTDAIHESHDAYTTPTLLRYEGQTQIIVSGGDYVTGHDPETGKEIWRAGGLNPKNSKLNRIVASPLTVDGMIYAPSNKKPVLALRAGGMGDVTTSHFAWKWDSTIGPDVPTPACDGVCFYMLDDRGAISCLNAKTGEAIWGPERTVVGPVSASPVVADGKLYITNEAGVTTVLAARPQYKVLATNTLAGEENVLSSMAISGDKLFIRTAAHLFCIGK